MHQSHAAECASAQRVALRKKSARQISLQRREMCSPLNGGRRQWTFVHLLTNGLTARTAATGGGDTRVRSGRWAAHGGGSGGSSRAGRRAH